MTSTRKPSWFREGQIFVSHAPTVGINKDGDQLFIVDPSSGERTNELDNKVGDDVEALLAGEVTETSSYINARDSRLPGVPLYHNRDSLESFNEFMQSPSMLPFESVSLGTLIDDEIISARTGHGSPASDLRGGDIPYIKVSDLRAGQVNINPTNMVSSTIARRFWRAEQSGLHSWDLLTPLRASKNIGDFCILLPGQEQVVLTKEMLVLRAVPQAPIDNFFLMWALTLRVVRQQWERVVFMQTNREDVGQRYREIRIPFSVNEAQNHSISRPFRSYFKTVAEARSQYLSYLDQSGLHHVHLGNGDG